MATLLNRRRYMGGGVEGEDYYIPYLTQYFTTEALEDGTFSFRSDRFCSSRTVSYSLDNGETWTSYTMVQNVSPSLNFTTPTVNAGNKVLWKCKTDGNDFSLNYGGISSISSTCACNVYGNVLSLIYGDGFVGENTVSSTSQVFRGSFYALRMINARNLIFPINKAYNACFIESFRNNSTIVDGPTFIIDEVQANAFYETFRGCTSLVNVTIVSQSFSSSQTNSFRDVTTNGVLYKQGDWTISLPSTWTSQEIKLKPL